jgi:hypothetical protein
VLGGVIDGLTNRQIDQRLGLAERTVKNQVASQLSKLGARHRTHAAVIGESAVFTSSPPHHSPRELPPRTCPGDPYPAPGGTSDRLPRLALRDQGRVRNMTVQGPMPRSVS